MKKRTEFVSGKLGVQFTGQAEEGPVGTGLQKISAEGRRDALLYIPAGYSHAAPGPLAVMLHGAGGQAEHGMSIVQGFADACNMIVLAPASQSQTWDIIQEQRFRSDILFLDMALAQIFRRYAIDKEHIAIGGFSDGASYALSAGLINGGLFTHILAFSPGFFHSPDRQGRPGIFISHGVHDDILPIEPCSRRIVPALRRHGYQVEYREFEGAHVLPAHLQEDAIRWFAES